MFCREVREITSHVMQRSKRWVNTKPGTKAGTKYICINFPYLILCSFSVTIRYVLTMTTVFCYTNIVFCTSFVYKVCFYFALNKILSTILYYLRVFQMSHQLQTLIMFYKSKGFSHFKLLSCMPSQSVAYYDLV